MLVFSQSSTADGGRAHQHASVAERADVGPLKLRVQFREYCPNETSGCELDPTFPEVLLNGKYQPLEVQDPSSGSGELKVSETCVGPTGYDGTVKLTVMPGETPIVNGREGVSTDDFNRTEIESIELVQAGDGECPSGASIKNGDFEKPLDESRWTWPNDGEPCVDIRGGFENRSAEVTDSCILPLLLEQGVNVPSDESTALQMDVDISGEGTMRVGFSKGAFLAEFEQTDGVETRTVCVPHSDLNTFRRLWVVWRQDRRGATVRFDNLSFVEEPGCERARRPVGGSFESEAGRAGWTSRGFLGDFGASFPTEALQSGQNTFARVFLGRDCSYSELTTNMRWPVSSSEPMPNAVAFRYRTQNLGATSANAWLSIRKFVLDGSFNNMNRYMGLQAADAWTKRTECVPEKIRGHRFPIHPVLRSGELNTRCGLLSVPAELEFDDIRLVHEAACRE
jgi:hypothetical protein